MKKREGFENQILITIPPEFYLRADKLTRRLYITDIGYFPKAADHWVSRTEGCSSSIIIICLNGKGRIESMSGGAEINAGEAVIIPENHPHKYGSCEGGYWEILWAHFSGDSADEVLKRFAEQDACEVFELSPGNDSRKLFSDICSDLEGGLSPLKYELVCAKFWHLIGCLSSDRNCSSGSSAGIIKDCILLMEDRLSASLTLEELGNKTAMTPQYLCRLFKQKTGHSPMEHYTQMKIRKACALLDMTQYSIGEISRQIGIDDPYYFTRVFKRVMGMPPRDYRKRQK